MGSFDLIIQHAAEQLWSADGEAALDYCKARNIHPEILKSFDVGWLSVVPKLKDDLDEKKKWNHTLGGRKGRLIFPVRGPSGKVTAIVSRSLIQKDYIIFYTDWGRKEPPIYGLDLSLPFIDSTREVWVVEGVFDTLALASIQYLLRGSVERLNVVGALTVSLSNEKIRQISRYADRLWWAMDNDAPARQAFKKIENVLNKNFSDVNVVQYPAKDLSEWWQVNPSRSLKFVEQFMLI